MISEVAHKDDSIVSTDTSARTSSAVTTSDEDSGAENTGGNSQSQSDSSGVGSSSDDSSDSDSDITSSDDDINGNDDMIEAKAAKVGMEIDRIDQIVITVVDHVSSERKLEDIKAITQNITVGSVDFARTSIQHPTTDSQLYSTYLPNAIPSEIPHRKRSKSKSRDLDLPYPEPTTTKATPTFYDTKSVGWGDVVEAAPWEWQSMPLDCTGILEEQRRTVFYEFRDKGNGEGEWVIPNYQNPPDYHGIVLFGTG